MLRKFHGALPGRIKKWLYVTLLVWPACILSPISRPHQPPSPSYSTFKTYGFKTKASKCQLFRKEVSYLGGLISSEGYRADPKNISTVQAKIKERLKTVTELRSDDDYADGEGEKGIDDVKIHTNNRYLYKIMKKQ